jgi:gliding motility-associated-like protein
MKNLYLTILSLCLLSLSSYGQSVQQVVAGSETYNELKAQGVLNSGEYEVVLPEGYDTGEHVTVYPAGHGTEGRDINCGCWVEPDDTYTLVQNFSASDDGATPQFPMPFDFNLYGDLYDSFYINTNGIITFEQPFVTFTPVGFPFDITMLAPFWGDVDFGCGNCGEVYFKITEDAVFVNYIEVGYFNEQSDKVNTFQAIFTNGQNDFVGVGNNVNFCYQDMQWTTGSASGGVNGFGGSPATVGANRGNSVDFIQFGRFSQNSANYDGPFGAEDGINWLDNQSFTFNAETASDNIQPIATSSDLCDTITVCVNQTEFISVEFIAPEAGQTVSLELDDGGATGISNVNVDEGSTSTLTFDYTGLPENAGGVFPIVVVATDDGDPPATNSITTYIEVIDTEVPDLLIDGATAFCASESTTLTGSEGFDSYFWTDESNNVLCEAPSCEFDTPQTVQLTATIDGCTVTSPPIDLEISEFFIVDVDIAQNPVCSNDSTVVTVPDVYPTYEWNNYLDFEGNLYGPTDEQSVFASSGVFVVDVVDENGCPGQRIFEIQATDADIPEDFPTGVYCDDLSALEVCCGSQDASEGIFRLFLDTNNGPWVEGATLEVIINGEVVSVNDTNIGDGPYPTNSQLINSNGQIVLEFSIVYGDQITVIYDSNGSSIEVGLNSSNCSFSVFNIPLSEEGGEVFSDFAGCFFTPAAGDWNIISGPEGASFSDTTQYNTFFTPSDWGTYELNFFSATCGIDYFYEVTFGQSPTLELLSDDVYDLCGDETQTLEVAFTDPLNDSEFSWSTEETTTSIDVSEGGTYCANITNQCAALEECVEVNITPIPSVDVDDEYQLCDGASIEIDPVDEDDDSFIYEWTNSGGVFSSNPTEDLSISDSYTVNVSNACGEDSGEFELSNVPTPTAVLEGITTLLCDGATELLDPVAEANEDPSFEYDWSNGSDEAEITVDESGTYEVTVSNECGEATAEVTIQALDTPDPSLQPSYTECDGGEVTLNPISNDPSHSYMWVYPDGSMEEPNNPSITVDEPGTYTFSVSNACVELPVEISTEVILNIAPEATLLANGADVPEEDQPILLCPLDAVQLEAQLNNGASNLSYSWSAVCGGDITNPIPLGSNESDIIVSSDQFQGIGEACLSFGTTYLLNVSNECGTSSDQVFLFADPCVINEVNIFSPNGDGENDTLYFEGLEIYFIANRPVKLEVFNRWGNLVYEDTDYKNDWTGDDVSDGTYYYILTLPEEGREKIRNPLTIVRD